MRLFDAVPLGRLAALRTLVYLFVPVDLLLTTNWVLQHKDVPGDLYVPLLIGRILPLPTPTYALTLGIFVALLVTSVVAATGRAPRLLGTAVFVLYLEWMVIAMSYGKVDHDRFGFLVALAVLPTVGRARWGDLTRSEAAGWALRATQLAVVATYFFAAWAKLRFGGLDWLTGATLTRAVLRRGTFLSDWVVDYPGLLVAFQFFIVAFELSSPVLLFLAYRWRLRAVAGLYGFHLMTYAAITISFLPHCVAMASFLPLEKVRPLVWLSRYRAADPARPEAART
ncbi:MAG: hypothetical protein JWN54_2488 [Mycobacterium sp.]|nr:hypothetical protein [Mycobacterium sp.]